MNAKLNKVQDILGVSDMPENRVKVEKKEKGLYEKTSESTILLTEDNKMMLND
jgi:hypothetical protein